MSQKHFRKRPMRCNHCGRLGHIRKYCRDLIKVEKEHQKEKDEKKKTHKAAPVSVHAKSSDSERSGLIASHALSALSQNEKCAWIVDSGATCHMYHDEEFYSLLSNKRTNRCGLGRWTFSHSYWKRESGFRSDITKW